MSSTTTEPAGLIRLRALALARLGEDEADGGPYGWGKHGAAIWTKYIADLESENPSHDGDCEKPYRPYICNCDKRARVRSGLAEWTDGDLIFVSPECPRCGNETTADDGFTCETCHAAFDTSGRFTQFTDDMGDDLMDGVDRAAIEAALLGGAS